MTATPSGARWRSRTTAMELDAATDRPAVGGRSRRTCALRRPNAPGPTTDPRAARRRCEALSSGRWLRVQVLQARAAAAEFERLRTAEFRDCRVVDARPAVGRGQAGGDGGVRRGRGRRAVATSAIRSGSTCRTPPSWWRTPIDYGIGSRTTAPGRIGRGHERLPAVRVQAVPTRALRRRTVMASSWPRSTWSCAGRGRAGRHPHGEAEPQVAELPLTGPTLERARRFAERAVRRIPSWRRRARPAGRRAGLRSAPRRWRRSGRNGWARCCGSLRWADPGCSPGNLRHSPRGAVLDTGGCVGRGGPGCSTCSPGREPWGCAVSRGASHAAFVDSSGAAVAAIRRNLAAAGIEAEVRRLGRAGLPQERIARRSSIRSRIPRSPISARTKQSRGKVFGGACAGTRAGGAGSGRERPAGAARARPGVARRAPLR